MAPRSACLFGQPKCLNPNTYSHNTFSERSCNTSIQESSPNSRIPAIGTHCCGVPLGRRRRPQQAGQRRHDRVCAASHRPCKPAWSILGACRSISDQVRAGAPPTEKPLALIRLPTARESRALASRPAIRRAGTACRRRRRRRRRHVAAAAASKPTLASQSYAAAQ